jgi:hypothetical protein
LSNSTISFFIIIFREQPVKLHLLSNLAFFLWFLTLCMKCQWFAYEELFYWKINVGHTDWCMDMHKTLEEIGASVSVCSSKFFSQIFEQLNWKNWGYNKPIRLLHVWINSTNTVIIVTYSDGAIINRFIASRLFPIIDYGNFPDSLSLLWHDIVAW